MQFYWALIHAIAFFLPLPVSPKWLRIAQLNGLHIHVFYSCLYVQLHMYTEIALNQLQPYIL